MAMPVYHSGCDGGDVRRAWHGAPHDKVSALLWTALGGLWERAYLSVSGSIGIRDVYSSGVLAAGWLLSQGSYISASRELTMSTNRNPPTPALTDQNPLHCFILSIYKSNFHKVYLLHFLCCRLTACFSLCNPFTTLYSTVQQ